MNILHIDDSRTDALILSARLADCADVVLRQALGLTDAAAHNGWADVVLLDLYMPDTPGPRQSIELCRALIPNRPILAYTAAELSDDERAELIAIGADDVVDKQRAERRVLVKILNRIHRHYTRGLAEDILHDTRKALRA